MNVNSVVPEESFVIGFETEDDYVRLFVNQDEMNEKMKQWDETGVIYRKDYSGELIPYRPDKIRLFKEMIVLTKEAGHEES